MKTLLMLVLALIISGCTNGVSTSTAAAEATELAKSSRRGAAREALFVKCMDLAAKMPRQADDDVAEAVQECSTQAYYMTNHIN